ncbi:hypothetical protein GCM10009665_53170 [Kitasatospora nipponensis]|uniref:Uncharacterized protein n=1 Tax=Kitasatospora nipponensis TaxID=258049 RepID=A0ABP4HCB4_9ACTN
MSEPEDPYIRELREEVEAQAQQERTANWADAAKNVISLAADAVRHHHG